MALTKTLLIILGAIVAWLLGLFVLQLRHRR